MKEKWRNGAWMQWLRFPPFVHDGEKIWFRDHLFYMFGYEVPLCVVFDISKQSQQTDKDICR